MTNRSLAILSGLAALLVSYQALAQNAQPSRNTARPRPAVTQPSPPTPAPVKLQAAQIEQKCLRALNGACTNPAAVEAVRLRAEIIPAVRVSYLGTPAGTIGGDYIPFERLFQDNPALFGLPTFTFFQTCCVSRTK